MIKIQASKTKINAYIIALYLFQFGFLQPFASAVNSQWPIAVFSMVLLVVMILNNGLKLKKYVFIILLLTIIFFLLNAIFYMNNTTIVIAVLVDFIIKCFSGVLIGSLLINSEEVYDIFLKVSVLNFFSIVLFPFVNFLDSMNYMRFGYAMLPSVIMFFYATANKKSNKIAWGLLSMISLSLTVIYGSRGPIVALMVFYMLLFLFSKKVSVIKKVTISWGAVIIAWITLQYDLIIRLIDYLSIKLGIRSYSLLKLRIMISEGLSESSSGRNIIYESILKQIKENPIFGNGIGYAQLKLDFTAHNIFLQILLESGILGLFIWSCIGIYLMTIYNKMSIRNEIGLFQVTTLLISLSLGRLLVSSDMWLRPELWLGLSILLNYKYINSRRVE